MKGASAPTPASEFMDSLNMLARERRIDREMLLNAVEAAIIHADLLDVFGHWGFPPNSLFILFVWFSERRRLAPNRAERHNRRYLNTFYISSSMKNE